MALADRRTMDLISKLLDRAKTDGYVRGPAAPDHWYEPVTFMLDMVNVHNAVPMDFQRMLEADRFNFIHDVAGIARHMNRETGQLEGGFLPRFAKREE